VRAMRTLDLIVPRDADVRPAATIGETILERCRNWPHPDLTLTILEVLNFPSDQNRRNAFRVAFNLAFGSGLPANAAWGLPDWRRAGEDFLDLLDPARVETQKRWRNAGNIFIALLSIAATKDSRLKGGPSVWKAIALLETGSANRDRLSRDWADYSDVAHLAAAAVSLADTAIRQKGPHPDITLETAILADPIRVLQAAAALQDRGLSIMPFSRKEPVLPEETLWRVPETLSRRDFKPQPLTEAEVATIAIAAAARQAKRNRKSTPQS
jgi:hypothetical protein